MREEDFMVAPDYDRPNRMGLIPGGVYSQSTPNYWGRGDMNAQTLEMRHEKDNLDLGAEVRRRNAAPQRLKKGGPVKMDGCAVRGKTKGRLT
jgi:hypothetical protein